MDSIYVVAFYSDQIVVRGGPESFWGLPGMIMGVVLPHEYTTWYATKVYLEPKSFMNSGLKDNKTIRRSDLERLLAEMDIIKNAGYYGQYLFRRILL
jgi:GLPGLI family protein